MAVTNGAVSSPDSSEGLRKAGFNPAVVLLSACAVGVFADRGALLAEPWSAFAEIGTPFVLVAFAAGRQVSRLVLGVLWGAAVLSVGQGAYYVWLFLAQDVAWGTLTYQYRVGEWLMAGALVGAMAGALGNASRVPRGGLSQTLGWGLLVAVPLAEGVWMARWQPPQVFACVALLVMAAGLYLWAVRQDRAPWQLGVVSALALGPAVLLAENFRHLV